MLLHFPVLMDVIEVVSIPFVESLEHICDMLKKAKPAYSNSLEGGKFRVSVHIQLGSTEGETNFVKVDGRLSRNLAYAKESAAEAAIHRIKLFHGFFIHDVNFDGNVRLTEVVKEKEQENNALKYQLEIIQTTFAAMNNVS